MPGRCLRDLETSGTVKRMAAIYRRARPVTFEQVIGQTHVKDVLVASIRRDRVGHAYLFSGPRGVGKTTTARLLAMAVNCERPLEQRPCGACESCLLVQSDAHPDVTELDAASNNSVEDIRDIREKVCLASLRGGSRVWILDEAHMLSRAAANALLKTLEEPPQGLIFILATTEPERLPPTILSRCQHFRFRRLDEEEIRGKLEQLCREADVETETAALQLVARSADGAMRDAESLLERLLASGEAISRGAAEVALGLPPQTQLEALATAVASGDLSTVHALTTALYRDGFSARTLIDRLSRTLRDALFTSVTGGEGFTVSLDRDALMRLIHTLDDEHERFVRRNDLYQLDAALIKGLNALSGYPQTAAPTQPTEGVQTARPPAPKGEAIPAVQAPSPAATESKRPEPGAPKAVPNAAPSLDWRKVKAAAGIQLKAFLIPARETIDDRVITLRFGDMHRFHYAELLKRQDELRALIDGVGGEAYDLVIDGPLGALRKKV